MGKAIIFGFSNWIFVVRKLTAALLVPYAAGTSSIWVLVLPAIDEMTMNLPGEDALWRRVEVDWKRMRGPMTFVLKESVNSVTVDVAAESAPIAIPGGC
jgi:hypothetical protein